jgi:hypothetical protein
MTVEAGLAKHRLDAEPGESTQRWSTGSKPVGASYGR